MQLVLSFSIFKDLKMYLMKIFTFVHMLYSLFVFIPILSTVTCNEVVHTQNQLV